jgi:leader peptidase (prepilin peptidase)/N-methyltransferase
VEPTPELEAALRSAGGYAAAAVFGALWGSFFNVCIARVPRGLSVVRPPSHCFACGTPVRPRDNVPILSFLLLRGRCRSCGARFSWRYPLVEAVGALLAALAWGAFVAGELDVPLGVRAARFVVGFAFLGVLLVLSMIDLDTKRLPDVITLPSIPVFFLAGFSVHQADWQERAIGAVGGYLVVRLVGDAYYYLRGREGLGLGDAKLLGVMGALLGWKALLPIVFGASFVGVFVSIPLILIARRLPAPAGEPASAGQKDEESDDEAADDPRLRYAQVPFGPFLSLAAAVYLLWGDRLWDVLAARFG